MRYGKNFSLAGLSLTPIRHHRRHQRYVDYYQTECTDCNLILRVYWVLRGISLSKTSKKNLSFCPFCQRQHLTTIKINEKTYHSINQQWDIVEASNQDTSRDIEDWFLS